MARHEVLCPSRGSHTNRDHGADRHALPETTLPLGRAGRHRLPQPEPPASHCPGALQLRDHRGPAMRAQQRGHHPGRPDVGQVSHHPVAVAGVLSAGLGQVGRRSRPTRRRRLLRAAAGLGPQGLAVDPPGVGPRRHLAGRPLHRAGDRRRLSRRRHPRGLEGPARQRRPRLEARVDRLAPRVLRPGPARLGRAGDDRSRPLRPLALPGDRRAGLAPADADHSPEQVPRGRLDVERGGHGAGPRRGPTLARAGAGVPQEAPAAAGVHAPGLLGAGARGGLVRADRPAPEPGRAAVVRDAGLDRARIPAAQERRLAMASDADDRPRARGAIVAGAWRWPRGTCWPSAARRRRRPRRRRRRARRRHRRRRARRPIVARARAPGARRSGVPRGPNGAWSASSAKDWRR